MVCSSRNNSSQHQHQVCYLGVPQKDSIFLSSNGFQEYYVSAEKLNAAGHTKMEEKGLNKNNKNSAGAARIRIGKYVTAR